MSKMKNSAAATAELNKKDFAHKITRNVATSPGLNSRSCRGGKTLPNTLLFLLFSATVFDELGGGKRYCQRKRALTLGLCQRAQRKLLLLFCSETRRSENRLQNQQQLLLLLFCGELGRIGGVATC